MAEVDYVHGYNRREHRRLNDQAGTLAELLHHDSRYGAGRKVLEAGCGVGAQTVIIAEHSPQAAITSIDISADSLEQARGVVAERGFKNVRFQQADIFDLPFEPNSFDDVFVCFVLEHLPDPVEALRCLKRVLKPDGTLTVIEGDHGSTYFHPASETAWRTIQCLIDLQAEAGGNGLIGRQLFPLVSEAGFREVQVSPRMVYVDSSRPRLVKGFTKNTFIAMVEGVKKQALKKGMMTEADWNHGIAEMYRTTAVDGTFCYTFFKAQAIK